MRLHLPAASARGPCTPFPPAFCFCLFLPVAFAIEMHMKSERLVIHTCDNLPHH